MSLRFAAARPAAHNSFLPLSRMDRIASRAANDNGDGAHESELLRAALEHFAHAGLAAAPIARNRARTAYYAGDWQGFVHWLGVCRTLDRKMGTALARNLTKRRARHNLTRR